MGLLDDAIREHLDLKRRRGADPAEIERLEREALGPVRREPSAFATEPPEQFAPTAVESAPAPDPVAGPDAEFAADAPFDEDEFGPAGSAREFNFEDATVIDTPEPEAPRAGGIAAPDYSDPDFDEFHQNDHPERRHRRLGGLFHRRSHESEAEAATPPPLPIEVPEDDPFLEPLDGGADPAPAPAIDPDPAADALLGGAEPPMLKLTPEPDTGQTVEYDVEEIFAEESPEDPAEEDGEDLLEETPDFLADAPDHDRLWFEQKPPPDFDFE